MEFTIERIKRRENACLVPEPIPGEPGLFRVDATWGTIQPMQVAEGVRTVGEVEVLEQLRRGLPVIDSRTRDYYSWLAMRSSPRPTAAATKLLQPAVWCWVLL
jgi:hypothetical protein